MKKLDILLIAVVLGVSTSAGADEVILDDLIVTQSLCVGAQCADGEVFDTDALKIKTDDPRIRFDDTSISASFPKNDWALGITDNGAPGPALFFVRDETADVDVIKLDAGADGGVALGAGSTIEPGAISFGAVGAERRVVHVADGVDPHDAVTMGQFTSFSDNINNNFATELADERAAVEAGLAAIQVKLDELTTRVDAIVNELNN